MAETATPLFSDGATERHPAHFGPEIERAFHELRQCCAGEVRCLAWNDRFVAASFSVPVDRPSRGTARGVDIRSVEPMLLLFDRRNYPHVAPLALSDRKDFPADALPHLVPVAPGQPAWLCLWRGDVNDWFAEHTLSDLVQRIRGWLRDAAAGMLIPDGDFFEATRLTDARGILTFDLRELASQVSSPPPSANSAPWFSFFSVEAQQHQEKEKSEATIFSLNALQWHRSGERLASRLQQYARHNEQAGEADQRGFGIVLVTAAADPIHEYFGRLPVDLAGLSEFCRKLGVPFDAAVEEYIQHGFFTIGFIPVILAIQRPQNLETGVSFEALCFLLTPTSGNEAPESLSPSTPVISLFHHFPLAPDRAAEIAGVNRTTQRTLLFGCGALGSKLALHRARAGNTALTAVDHATLAAHNLVRHGLTGKYRGLPKAEALRQAIADLFAALPPTQQPKAYVGSALEWLHGSEHQHLNEHHLLIDATASSMLLDALNHARLPAHLKVARCGIADAGRLGLLLLEGPHRNPRVDDIQVWLYDQALERADISLWLKQDRRHKEQQFSRAFAEVPLGLGCSSVTMRLSDDMVSLHAAQLSLTLRNLAEGVASAQHGWLVLQCSNENGLSVERLAVDPVRVIQASGARNWQVRLHPCVVHEIRARLLTAAPNETGGIMIGTINPKRRTIYVTRLLDAPADSTSSPCSFKRGTRNLPAAAEQAYAATGGLLGFVGDWHTHPRGSGAISPTDIAAMQKTKRNFDTAGLPTFILIATPKGFRAYLTEPD